jgi:DNA-binding NarL/FixJ family response regulator
LSENFKKLVKILIVDDDELHTQSLKLLLENILSINLQINTLNTGHEVIEEIKKEKYDIVFLDNKLPGKNGINILRDIKRSNIKTNVIFLTGFSDEELAVRAMKLGAKDYIAKGNLDVKRLIEAVNEIVIYSCSKLEIPREVLTKLQEMFRDRDELDPSQFLEVKYNEKGFYEQEVFRALNMLHERKLVEKTRCFSTVTCPHCGSLPEEFYLVCPVCSTKELVKGEVIEHHKCHHIDFKSNFVDEKGNFVCPKCGEKLNQIGVDYVKVGTSYKCSNSHMLSSPEHRYFCGKCEEEFSEDESKLITIYKYRVTSEGKTSLNICDMVKEEEI